MKSLDSAHLRTALRWLLGLLMLWAAVSKLSNPTAFLGSLYGYELWLPPEWMQVVAVVLPWIELLCGLLLLVNAWTESALTAVTGLLIVFVLATGQAWARGLDISCGCFNLKIFGLSEGHPAVKLLESVAFAFFRNLALTTIAAFLLRKRLKELENAGLSVPVPPPTPAEPVKDPKPARA